MDILLVDDEVYTLRVLKSAVHWEDCGIENVWTALSAARAREILEAHPVDLIICDIEMPKETGLDLLRWVRDKNYNAEFILLTCHTDFSYAQQALKLGALDYCVKPVIVEEIEKVIKRAAQNIEEKRRSVKAMEDQALWEKNKAVVNKAFWREVLEGRSGKGAEEMLRLARDSSVFIEVDEVFHIAVFSLKFQPLEGEEKYRFLDFTRQYFKACVLLENEEQTRYCAIGRDCLEEAFIKLGEQYLVKAQSFGGQKLRIVGCYCCNVYFEELPGDYKAICETERMMTTYHARFFNIRNRRVFPDTSIELPKAMEQLLYAGKFKEFEEEFSKWLDEKSRRSHVDVSDLNMLRADICQILDVYLKGRNISAHTIFFDETMCQVMNEAARSVDHMTAFIHELSKIVPFEDGVTNITNAVKKYISHHIDGEITRGDIAGALYLNADYISRVFKKDTGMTIPQYINQARIRRATELLTATDLAVGDVAEAVGYSNFSYFSKIFRQYEGCSPREYKLRQK